MLTSIDFKALFVFISAAIAIPSNGLPVIIDAIIRLLIPIVGGVIWVFLKPKVIKWREKLKK